MAVEVEAEQGQQALLERLVLLVLLGLVGQVESLALMEQQVHLVLQD
jgi:hypothetical protein